MFEIIDHKDFATVRLMDGGSQMQFAIKTSLIVIKLKTAAVILI